MNKIKENPEVMDSGNPRDLIYKIDEIRISGAFESGLRSIDHSFLWQRDYSDNRAYFINVDTNIREYFRISDVMRWGTIVVPETECYIADEPDEEFDALGYQRMPYSNNHIVGYK